MPIVAAVNRFPDDSESELNRLAAYCAERAVGSALCEGFAMGGPGTKELAEKVVATIDKNPSAAVHALYSFDESLPDKIKKVAQTIYGASDVKFSDQAAARLKQFSDWGYSKLPVCMAKTQYSRSDNPKLLGVPTGLDPQRNERFAFGRRWFRRRNLRQHDAHAGPAESFSRRLDRCRPFREDHRHLR